jgi:hypothetical protein
MKKIKHYRLLGQYVHLEKEITGAWKQYENFCCKYYVGDQIGDYALFSM